MFRYSGRKCCRNEVWTQLAGEILGFGDRPRGRGPPHVFRVCSQGLRFILYFSSGQGQFPKRSVAAPHSSSFVRFIGGVWEQVASAHSAERRSYPPSIVRAVSLDGPD